MNRNSSLIESKITKRPVRLVMRKITKSREYSEKENAMGYQKENRDIALDDKIVRTPRVKRYLLKREKRKKRRTESKADQIQGRHQDQRPYHKASANLSLSRVAKWANRLSAANSLCHRNDWVSINEIGTASTTCMNPVRRLTKHVGCRHGLKQTSPERRNVCWRCGGS